MFCDTDRTGRVEGSRPQDSSSQEWNETANDVSERKHKLEIGESWGGVALL